MRDKFSKIALAAILGFALAFTFSCSSDDGGDSNNGSGVSSPSGGGTSSPSGGGLSSCTGGVVTIGTQTWHKCNLNVVPSKGKSACYDNKPENCDKYGRLYDWEAAKSACPSGFHLPTNGEWNILLNYAGGDDVAGGKLKAKSGWPEGGNGTDAFEFAALPGGGGRSNGTFTSGGELGILWSATECDASRACALVIGYTASVLGDNGDKASLFTVRCVQN
ncbi:hypothetical protein R83H12_01094 [Fibrobacteria bacterium R8-3-H12]